MRQALVFGAAAALFVGLLAGAEAATRRWKIDPEVSRKLVHLSSGVAAACLPLVMSFVTIVVLALLFIPFMVFSRRVGLFPAVHGVERQTWGEVYFPLGVLLAAALFPRTAPYSYGVLVMGVSDAFASFAGQRYGRRDYRVLSAHKTYLGSAAFFLMTSVIGAAYLVPGSRPWGPALLVGFALAGALTVVEGLSAGGIDNVLLPVTAAGLLWLAL